ncbi:MAG: four helix bundle protein [Opitutaceae bacterium]|nr:four helix bundle protein [Opitutaceae bacterium]
MRNHRFRFQQFDIWKRAIAIGSDFHDIASDLESRGYRRYAEQLRAAALSISNNIAEGSGSDSDKEFAHFLNIARRSAFETANIMLFLHAKSVISTVICDQHLQALEEECRMITAFRRTL